MEVGILVILPALLSLLSWLGSGWALRLTAFAHLGLWVQAIRVTLRIAESGTVTDWGGFFRLDGLSALFLMIIALVATLTSWFGVVYFTREMSQQHLTPKKLSEYLFWFNLLVATMYLTVTAVNLGVVWVAIEATTVTSVLLVGFDNQRSAIEAAWKYGLICSVGIILALIGVMLLNFAALSVAGRQLAALDWRELTALAGGLDRNLVKVAFIFILVGFGTKAGLAPLHTWLPDAHSQAPTPVSALLSGVLLNCALYGVLRIGTIVGATAGIGFVRQFLTGFGLLSIAVAIPFLLIQFDLKRLLAYSSIENMGLIAFGLGLGGKWAVAGGLLQIFNHALAKSGLFLAAGEMVHVFHSKRIQRMRGLFKAAPGLAVLACAGLFILSGAPPFAIFFSKAAILYGGLQQGRYWSTFACLALLTLAFTGLLYHFSRVLLGTPGRKASAARPDWRNLSILAIPVVLLLVTAFYQPSFWKIIISDAVRIVGGI
jgi:hydrogenase-4 component F